MCEIHVKIIEMLVEPGRHESVSLRSVNNTTLDNRVHIKALILHCALHVLAFDEYFPLALTFDLYVQILPR